MAEPETDEFDFVIEFRRDGEVWRASLSKGIVHIGGQGKTIRETLESFIEDLEWELEAMMEANFKRSEERPIAPLP
jgi:hypothetical protein